MNKDLEKEYKELMQKDAPDLWGRIEAGLEPKEPVVRNKVNFWRKYRTWGAAAAACLCLIITVPVLLQGFFNGEEMSAHNKGANFSPAMDDERPHGNLFDLNKTDEWSESPKGEHYDQSGGMSSESHNSVDTDSELHEPAADGAYSSETNDFCTIIATVMEVLEEAGERVYLVRLVETDGRFFSEGDIIRLYEWDVLEYELAEGETYLIDLWIRRGYGDAEEYYIYDYENQ